MYDDEPASRASGIFYAIHPGLDSVAKPCMQPMSSGAHSDSVEDVEQAVLTFLRKRGYSRAEESLKQDMRTGKVPAAAISMATFRVALAQLPNRIRISTHCASSHTPPRRPVPYPHGPRIKNNRPHPRSTRACNRLRPSCRTRSARRSTRSPRRSRCSTRASPCRPATRSRTSASRPSSSRRSRCTAKNSWRCSFRCLFTRTSASLCRYTCTCPTTSRLCNSVCALNRDAFHSRPGAIAIFIFGAP